MENRFEKLISHLDELELTTVHGRITEVVGMLIKAIIPDVKMGEVCMVKRDGSPLMTEVVGFTKDEVFLSPLGEMTGIGPSSEVIPLRMQMYIKVGPGLLGRVLNGLGQPLDVDTTAPCTYRRELFRHQRPSRSSSPRNDQRSASRRRPLPRWGSHLRKRPAGRYLFCGRRR